MAHPGCQLKVKILSGIQLTTQIVSQQRKLKKPFVSPVDRVRPDGATSLTTTYSHVHVT